VRDESDEKEMSKPQEEAEGETLAESRLPESEN
jgi:hypothetical protein